MEAMNSYRERSMVCCGILVTSLFSYNQWYLYRKEHHGAVILISWDIRPNGVSIGSLATINAAIALLGPWLCVLPFRDSLPLGIDQ
ncbi:hypothetical protein D3C73_600020 [compost metagenome]